MKANQANEKKVRGLNFPALVRILRCMVPRTGYRAVISAGALFSLSAADGAALPIDFLLGLAAGLAVSAIAFLAYRAIGKRGRVGKKPSRRYRDHGLTVERSADVREREASVLETADLIPLAPEFPEDGELDDTYRQASLKTWLTAEPGGSVAAEKSTRFATADRILVADDNEINREYLAFILRDAGYETILVPDGRHALDVLAEPEARVRLLITDIQMPVVDGYELMRTVRNSDGIRYDRELPIVALTAYSFDEDSKAIKEAGADETVVKPFRPEKLRGLVGNLLAAHPRAVPSEYQPTPGDPVDVRELIENFNGNDDFLLRSMRLFLKNIPLKLERLEAALNDKNDEEAANAAHSIAGGLGILCARECEKSARTLMIACRENHDQDVSPDYLSFMERLRIFIRFLRNFV
jgi:CheY-like chemotaxis protein